MGNASERRSEWTNAHKREACARTHELVGRMVLESGIGGAPGGGATAPHEGDFRWWLRTIAGFDAARVEREVRRVDRLARGEWVRKVEHLVVHEKGGERHVRSTTIGRPR